MIDEAGVIEKWGVAPVSIPDYLGLVGDRADGIPGIPGWGAKGTAAVLGAYGRIEDIPVDVSDWSIRVRGAARLAGNLESAREDALLYRRLATLRTDAPIDTSLETLRWMGGRRTAFEQLAEELGVSRLVERVPSWQPGS